MMKTLTLRKPHHLSKIHDELLAAFPEWIETTHGERRALHSLCGDGETLTLSVPDATDDVAVQAVVDAHDPTPPVPSYRDQRKVAYLDELGAISGDFVETVGDVMDDLIREVRALAAAPVTPEFAALAAKVDAIKDRFPKPR
jgi:hypothetical protein